MILIILKLCFFKIFALLKGLQIQLQRHISVKVTPGIVGFVCNCDCAKIHSRNILT